MLDRFVKLLPQTNSRLLRIVVVSLAMACLWFAVAYFRGAISGRYDLGVLSFVLWLPLAVGLWLIAPHVKLAKAAAIGFLMMQFRPMLPIRSEVAEGGSD